MIRPEEHLNLVNKTVHKMYNKIPALHYYDIEDLCSIGYLELVRISDKFDESKGYKFSTFAVKCIQNSIFRILQKEKNADVKCFFNNKYSLVSLNDTLSGIPNGGEDKESYYETVIPSEEDFFGDILRKECVKSFLNSLKEKERAVIDMLYIQNLTYEQACEIMQCSRGTLASRRNRAIKKMRKIAVTM